MPPPATPDCAHAPSRQTRSRAETRASALYRMAEVQLANVDSLDTGLEALRKALDDSPNFERAAAILRRTTEQHEHNNQLLDAYELVARDSGDDRVMLHYLEQRARQWAKWQGADFVHVGDAWQFEVGIVGHVGDGAVVEDVDVEGFSGAGPHGFDDVAGVVGRGLVEELLDGFAA